MTKAGTPDVLYFCLVYEHISITRLCSRKVVFC